MFVIVSWIRYAIIFIIHLISSPVFWFHPRVFRVA